nr:hypothetical protein [uncultured Rhodopila sp.]
MSAKSKPILVDTNVIIEGHRTKSWRTLTQRFQVETVEECVMETQTGAQNRRPEQQIGESALRGALHGVHAVSDLERASALLRDEQVRMLDPGEQALWAHALRRMDGWLLCGPDKASVRLGVRLGFRERMVSLEALLDEVGHRPQPPLRTAYTKKWLSACLTELTLQEGKGLA